MSDKLIDLIETITKMYLEREKEITAFDYMVCVYRMYKFGFFCSSFSEKSHYFNHVIFFVLQIKKEENHCICNDSKYIKVRFIYFNIYFIFCRI